MSGALRPERLAVAQLRRNAGFMRSQCWNLKAARTMLVGRNQDWIED